MRTGLVFLVGFTPFLLMVVWVWWGVRQGWQPPAGGDDS